MTRTRDAVRSGAGAGGFAVGVVSVGDVGLRKSCIEMDGTRPWREDDALPRRTEVYVVQYGIV